ncbi:uncharacterized protein J4E88_009425 [Alternaria novae-zelandiae]|uniref:uncharacterized protein n=1 Tax=Alternaria novae-zelandiae TaxID=430562 RepID=UPI0020C45B63|nr:uncharacterized protein J4E88_009425 [Alternaria novae-zelandiae]KAI4671030.1 hypothetical protein J4E88_009425 [Alternaria novae-zelandiae]
MKLTLATLSTLLATATTASPLALEPRQQCSTSWSYPYTGRVAPGNYKAFNLGSCTAQLTFNKDRYVGVQWAFEATYADGSRAELKPFRDFDSFGVSDTFYPYLGNNFLTKYPGNSAFTAVHEFSSVCKNGQAPVSWRFYTTSGTSNGCYTTGQIRAVGGVSRPAKVAGVSLRRSNDAGDFQVSWSPVSSATAYSVIVEYPTGTDEVGNPYTNVRGARVQGTSTQIATTTRRQDVARKAIVHAVNSQGVWSFTSDVQPVVANW